MMPTVSSMAPFLLLVQDDQKEMNMVFCHVMPAVPASPACDANAIINGTTEFV